MKKGKTIEMPTATETAPEKIPEFTWSPDAMFSLTGQEFEIAYKNLQVYVQQPKVQEVMAIVTMYEIMRNCLQRNIDDGSVTSN